MSPYDQSDRALQDGMKVMQPVPTTALLDLHLALHHRRYRNTDNPVDFAGCSWAIAHTLRKTVSIIHHPGRPFWVVTEPPAPPENRWPEVLGEESRGISRILDNRRHDNAAWLHSALGHVTAMDRTVGRHEAIPEARDRKLG